MKKRIKTKKNKNTINSKSNSNTKRHKTKKYFRQKGGEEHLSDIEPGILERQKQRQKEKEKKQLVLQTLIRLILEKQNKNINFGKKIAI